MLNLSVSMGRSIFNAVGDFFALDIGSSAIRAVQVRGSNHSLVRFASIPIESKVTQSDSEVDQRFVGEKIKELVQQAGITSHNVVMGLPSNKTYVTIVDIPKMSHQELENTIKYQADQYVPIPLDEAKLDFAIVGDSPVEQGKSEVLLASVSKKFSEQRMELLESLGFNVIALEPDSLALARSLTPTGSTGAQVIVDMGEFNTDIVITLAGTARLVRTIPTGSQTLLKSAAQNLNIDESQAKQFVYKFGLDEQKLEGQIYRSLESSVELVATEVQKSIKFFTTRYKTVQLSGISTTGFAAILPGFHAYLSTANNGAPVQAGNSWQNINYGNSNHEQLMSINHEFAVVNGLAARDA